MAEPVAKAAVAASPDDALAVPAATPADPAPRAADPVFRNGLRPVPADGAGPDADELRRQIDALSLSQALLDFEVANARVLDLTARLVDAGRQVVEMQQANDGLRTELEAARAENERLEKRHRRLVASTSYRWANRLWTLRKAITGK